MNAFDYITAIQNANGPILNVAQSLGIAINQINVMNNSFANTENIVNNFSEAVKENNSSIGFFKSGLASIENKIKDTFSVDTIIAFGKEVFNARVAYEKLNGIKGGISDEFEKLKTSQSEFATAWNTFLVSLGGDTTDSFKGFISFLNKGVSFLTQQLPNLSAAFSVLWIFIQPIVKMVQDLAMGILDLIIGITESRTIMITLGGILLGLGVNFLLANIQAYAFSAALGILEGVIWLVEGATAAWNFVMAMNPISLVIIGIAALVAIVWSLWDRFESVRGTIMGVWEVMKGFGMMIKNYVINRFHELLSGVTGIGQALAAFFSGDFKKAWEIGKKAAGDLMGVNSKKQLIEDGLKAAKSFNTGYNKGVKMNAPEITTKSEIAKKNPTSQLKIQQKALLGEPNSPVVNAKMAKTAKTAKTNTVGSSDSIVSGGPKATNIIINIQKLQDDTKIYVESSEKGISNLGEKVQEMLLRAVNSVNQMQTAV
ncbi:hypothetical protein LNQ49_06365 [Flavobacterium sp. F-65]|jgi:hypothetical protein|uniref:Phage tail tape measure protein, TP901 family, core region n=1 Tax=Flavobacterium pisciphilum TaxID=2893755 RepID=A0ABS8MSQ2_9FLAO|nr:hypothetical protein [Flavobacterium sp. F-65]MCC9071216.1 hypothetical protein [Flavobacterium sp. F-65]